MGGLVAFESLALVFSWWLLAAACTPNVEGTSSRADRVVWSGAVTAALGDVADHSCQVVLREVYRPAAPTGGGFLTQCGTSGCFYVWQGTIDVAASAVSAGAVPSVVFQTTSVSPTWFTVPTTKVNGAGTGFQRYAFTIDHDTVTDSISLTSLMRTVIEVEPLLTMPDGSRLWDHNRNAGGVTNYVLDQSSMWAIADDPSACAPPASATLRFLSSWQEVQEGALVQGGSVTVVYDLARLPQCVGSTYQGEPAWSISGFARFSPGGQVISGPLTHSVASGRGSTVAAEPWTLAVPTGASSIALWFETTGETCATFWDSNYGANYAFPVAAAPTAQRPAWAGNWAALDSRGCMASDWGALAEPMMIDQFAITQATCLDLAAEVWIPSLTDLQVAHPEWVLAQVQYSKDGAPLESAFLDYSGRSGNNYRYQWDLRRAFDFVNVPWSSISYSFRFSTDGNTWYQVGQGPGPSGGASRTLKRGSDFCPSSWGPPWC
jgi:hypothetical protein